MGLEVGLRVGLLVGRSENDKQIQVLACIQSLQELPFLHLKLLHLPIITIGGSSGMYWQKLNLCGSYE